MKKVLFALVLGMSLALLPGFSTPIGESYPDLGTDLSENDYEVLGPVTLSGGTTKVLGLIESGSEKGYAALLEEARKLYPETNALININVEDDKTHVLGIYKKTVKVYSATAIKFKGEALSEN